MLVVSNIDLTTDIAAMKPSKFLESSIKDFTLNISDDYRYMKTGYYVSLHAEVLGNNVIPSSENIIDATRTPIMLLRAERAGIPTMPFLVTDSVKKIISEVAFPLVLFAVNPFIHEGFKIANNKSALYRAMKSLGMNYKFPVCIQPLKGEINSFKSIFGNCGNDKVRDISKKVYQLFKIPICKLYVQKINQTFYLCGLQPLKKDELSPPVLKTLNKEVLRISRQGEHDVV